MQNNNYITQKQFDKIKIDVKWLIAFMIITYIFLMLISLALKFHWFD